MSSAAASWKNRARAAADRRRQLWGADVPPAVARLLADDGERLGFFGALRLAIYVVIGSPSQVFRLWWRALVDRDTPRRRRQITELAKRLRPRLSPGARVLEGTFERKLYSHDLGRVPPAVSALMYRTMPTLVVQPRAERDVAAAFEFAREQGLDLFPRGISSSAFGGTVPTTNGLVLDLSTMSAVVAVDAEAETATVEPGARWSDLARELEPFGLVPMTTPTSRFSTVAAWIVTGGMGVEGYRYGPVFEAIRRVRLVTPAEGVVVLEAGDDRLEELVGSEGQLGVITEVTLAVRPRPSFGSARLVTFDSPAAAIDALEQLGDRPSHVVFFDAAHMKKENLIASDRKGRELELFEPLDSLLLYFDDPEAEAEALALLEREDEGEIDIAGRYLWSDRFFPLKGQRLGPNMLATEVVLPPEALARFVAKAKALGRRFGSSIGLEATICREGERRVCVVIASFACDSSRRFDYLLRLVLVQLLTHLGLRLGGRPYGLGIWNTPFIGRRFDRARRRALARSKAAVDPWRMLNPGKFFAIRTRFWSLPGLIFLPAVLGLGLYLALALSPLLGAIGRLTAPAPLDQWEVPPADDDGGRALLEQTGQRCTLCGNCVAACPAYLITGDEQVTGRSKLQLAAVLAAEDERDEVSDDEAHSPFQCLRCGLCEEVCQTALPLRDCYLALEGEIEQERGAPTELIATFVERLEADKAWIESTFALELAEWTPGARGLSDDRGQPRGGEEVGS